MDTRKRSWAKSVTWRIAGVVILGGITYSITRDLAQTTGITLFFHALRFALYYCHERLWDRTDWGRVRHPLADIRTRLDLTTEDREKIRRFMQDHGYLQRWPRNQVSGILRSQPRRGSAIASSS